MLHDFPSRRAQETSLTSWNLQHAWREHEGLTATHAIQPISNLRQEHQWQYELYCIYNLQHQASLLSYSCSGGRELHGILVRERLMMDTDTCTGEGMANLGSLMHVQHGGAVSGERHLWITGKQVAPHIPCKHPND